MDLQEAYRLRVSEHCYTDPLHVATQLRVRQNMGMRQRVEQWWQQQGWPRPDFIDCLPQQPAVIARHIPKARYEECLFFMMALYAGLQPTWLSYIDDVYDTNSGDKTSCLVGHTCAGYGRKGGPKLSTRDLVGKRPWMYEGKPLSAILAADGRLLVELHRQEHVAAFPGCTVCDMSAWLKQIGRGNAASYYTAYLSLFMAHGVLFEDYHGGETGERLQRFTGRIFEPAWRSLMVAFDMPPLIVALPWHESLAWYPPSPARWHEFGVVPGNHFDRYNSPAFKGFLEAKQAFLVGA